VDPDFPLWWVPMTYNNSEKLKDHDKWINQNISHMKKSKRNVCLCLANFFLNNS
jgi:hypothetical protein